jgi:hypothetical protein
MKLAMPNEVSDAILLSKITLKLFINTI